MRFNSATLNARLLTRHVITVAAAAVLSVGTALAAQSATYHDVEAMDAAIDRLDGAAGGRMRVHIIGTTWAGRPVRAVHVAATPNLYDTGAEASMANKPALLIECGMHAREWAGPELCLKYLQTFPLALLLDPIGTDDMLANADIWVIPMVNPDGRAIDDTFGGDPNKYTPNKDSTFLWHDGDAGGWRPNAQVVSCRTSPFGGYSVGIDVARNFSTGWSVLNPTDPEVREDNCDSDHFHGDAPFQAFEAQILRRFVDNRMISMSLSVHSDAQSLGIRTASLTAIATNAGNLWQAATPSLPLTTGPTAVTGGGRGQFPAWMANPSNTPGEPDFGTSRSAVALLMELPPGSNDFDRANGFHPSEQVYLDDTLPGFIAAVRHLAKQTRRPWCPLTPGTLAPSAACRRDVGFTGAKLAVCLDCVGTLQESPYGLGSRQTNTPGLRHIVYRVQNFDSTTAANLQVTVSVSSRAIGPGAYTYTTDLTSATPLALASGAAATGSVPFTFVAGRDYLVSISATPTSYSGETNTQNNSRLFRFIVQ